MILVTGGCGFIGREVVRELLARGERVRVADNLSKPYGPPPEGCEFVRADLARADDADAVFAGVRVCINLAARIGGIGYFHRYPAEILSENARIYSNTFEAAVRAKLERMLFVSSSMVYESTTRFPSREEDVATIPVPYTAYGFSKLMGEWYCRAFHEQYGLPYTVIRPFNAYGPGEKPGDQVGESHVIPDLVGKAMRGGDVLEVLGDGRQTRCYTHVRDVARGIVVAASSPRAVNEAFNLSTPTETTVRELAEKILGLCAPGRNVRIVHVPGFPSDIRRRIPETSKARELLGWQAAIDLDAGLREVVAAWGPGGA